MLSSSNRLITVAKFITRLTHKLARINVSELSYKTSAAYIYIYMQQLLFCLRKTTLIKHSIAGFESSD